AGTNSPGFGGAGFREGGTETAGSICLYACELHHLGPLLGFVGDEPAEVGGRARNHDCTEVGEPCLYFGIRESRIDLLVELVDDLGGCVFWEADALPEDPPLTPPQITPPPDVPPPRPPPPR